jgi:hypothetical protein
MISFPLVQKQKIWSQFSMKINFYFYFLHKRERERGGGREIASPAFLKLFANSVVSDAWARPGSRVPVSCSIVWLALACTLVNFDRGGALVLKGKGDASCGFCTPPYEHAKVYKTLLLHKFSPLHALLTLQVRGNSKLSTAVLFVFNMLRTNGLEKTPRTKKQLVPHTRIDCYIIPSKIRKLRPSSCSLLSPSQENPTFFTAVKHYLDFCFVFSAPLPAWRNLYSGPTGLGHRSQITEGPLLRPFTYTKNGCLYKFYLHQA